MDHSMTTKPYGVLCNKTYIDNPIWTHNHGVLYVAWPFIEYLMAIQPEGALCSMTYTKHPMAVEA